MRTTKIRKAALIGVVSGIAMCGVGSVSADAPIHVNVNGNPVNFSGAQPTEIQGAVLVPLRGVFEAMGAGVDYNSATRTINAKKGNSYVTLPLGSTFATVNGQSQTLSQPARVVNGTTLVPLRFVAQALGGYVEWQAASSTVAIKTPESQISNLPPAPGGGRVVGQVTGVYPNANPPQISLRIDGQDTVVPLSNSTIVLSSIAGQPGTEVSLNDIHVGDQVVIRRSPDGVAESLTSTHGEFRGMIKSVGRMSNGGNVLTLNDGTTVPVAADANLTMNGRHVTWNDIKPYENVLVRTNPDNDLAYSIVVNPGNGPGPEIAPEAGGATANAFSDITSFTHNAVRPLRSGDVLSATLIGAPGGIASFDIPGVAENIPMNEAAPGRYVGLYTVGNSLAVNGAAVIGHLTVNNRTSPLIQAANAVTINSIGPKITSFSPARGASVDNATPPIYATISDPGGVGIDTDSSRIFIDGQDMTQDAAVTPTFISVKPTAALAPGTHKVRISLVDRAGNQTNTEYPFTVTSDTTVRSLTSSAASNQALSAGTKINFTLQAQPGGTATLNIGSLAQNIPLFEGAPGVYTGSYTVAQGDNITNAPVTATFVGRNGRTITTSLPNTLTMAAGTPIAPEITSPVDGSSVASQTITVRGVAAPFATVRVKVDYTSKALGGLFAVNGNASTTEVTADKNGNWIARDLPLQTKTLFTSDRDTEFNVSAASLDANGQESVASSIGVKGGKVYAHHAGQ